MFCYGGKAAYIFHVRINVMKSSNRKIVPTKIEQRIYQSYIGPKSFRRLIKRFSIVNHIHTNLCLVP